MEYNLEFKTLTIEDKPLIDKLIKHWQLEHTESSFANMYIWRHSVKLRYCIYDDRLLYLMETVDGMKKARAKSKEKFCMGNMYPANGVQMDVSEQKPERRRRKGGGGKAAAEK